MIKIKPNEGNLLVWRERKLISDSMFAPDDFDRTVLEELPIDEANALQEEWNKEEDVYVNDSENQRDYR